MRRRPTEFRQSDPFRTSRIAHSDTAHSLEADIAVFQRIPYNFILSKEPRRQSCPKQL
jgi:hypothetical protein